MKRLLNVFLIALVLSPTMVKGDEGMWLPMFINKLNYADMQGRGLKLTPEEIYSVNNSSMKDGIVRLGRGFCSGEMISKEGLFLTNHHCGFDVVQENSTVEHDYLKNGFWAMSKEEELPAGFSVSYLVRMEDVSKEIIKNLKAEMTEIERQEAVEEAKQKYIEAQIKADSSGLDYEIKGFFKGNEYYMLVYNTFDDVRLVGAPPSSIGKFGGDTDNWMWPRHTGDFTLFRVYADKDNNSAPYDSTNVPYKPKHHFPISMKGVEQGDYAMIFGYPGSTNRYLTSFGVKLAVEKDQPTRVVVRRKKLDLYEEGQAKSAKIRIQYASKHASVSNYWKYYIGQTRGLKQLNVYAKKKAQEEAFMRWTNANPARKEKYGKVISMYEEAYKDFDKYQLAGTYLEECIFGIEILRYGFGWNRLKKMYDKLESYESGKYKKDEEYTEKEAKEQAEFDKELPKTIEDLKKAIDGTVQQGKFRAEGYFKDYNQEIDRKVLIAMLKMYNEGLPEDQKPMKFNDVMAKYKNDYAKFADDVFAKSFIATEKGVTDFLNNPSNKTLSKDPIVQLAAGFSTFLDDKMDAMFEKGRFIKRKADRLYVAGLREMNPKKSYYPDANSTMRVTYGNVLAYAPNDAVKYSYFTTLEGIMEKEDPSNDEFIVPAKLKSLHAKKDYGRYAAKDGKIHTCFISNNDITGGNSGSGVFNDRGELIGTAFDGNWEAMSGDIAFEPKLQRTISVDIRYTLFIIDKYAGATHLIKEMDLVYDNTNQKNALINQKRPKKAAFSDPSIQNR